MPKKHSYITVTDQFCGAGGSSIGAKRVLDRVGGEVKLAMNHWKLAIETHNTNFPNTLHDCTDISACDPRRYPSTDILITSPERLGPLTMEAREWGLQQVLSIQDEVNAAAVKLGRPPIDILNAQEVGRIHELIAANTWPDKWTGDEPTADMPMDKTYADGSVLVDLFKNFQ